YITSSIIMQLLTMVVPRLEQLYKEEGEQGRQKFNMWTRMITVPLAAVQTFAMISLLRSQNVLVDLSAFDVVIMIVTATAGTIFLMWLGELITEKGLGNGVSVMIFAGIVASLPTHVSRLFATFDPSLLFTYLLFIALGLVTVIGVVIVSEGQRKIPVAYAKRVRGNTAYGGSATHLPLRVNQAGVIPIIFAISLALFPQMIANFLAQSGNASIAQFAATINSLFQNQLFFGMLYFFLVVAFTFFYTAVIFDPQKISENLQKQGGYIPGIRPGSATAEYLYRVSSRITLTGALFLGLIAVLPIGVQAITGIQALTLGGTSILIAVSVVIEMVKHIESQMAMRDYDSF
ncbi:MAG TPA: preprotein translocase subunit SecY, partial [Patescibacteria group bacterium]|nr:preprotein translocase subunit SecY [Patescibacteria group bacterium]